MNIKTTLIFLVFILSIWLIMPVEDESKDTFSGQKKIPAKNKELIYLISRNCSTLDPAKALDDSSALIISNIFEGLVQFNSENNNINPSLATNWKISQDGLEWTFKLREGVKFHDGTPFNAQAVKFSVMRQLQQAPDMLYSNFVYGPVEEIDIVDQYTIKFKLKYPYTPFLNNLAMPFSAPVVSPTAVKKYGDDFWRNPVGTGPFQFDSWQEETVSLKKNSSYWGNKPNIDAIKFQLVPEESERIKKLSQGEAHIISNISAGSQSSLQKKGYKTYHTTGLDINYLGFYVNKPPFSHLNARKAVKLALDNNKIVQNVLNDNGVPANTIFPPYMQINFSTENSPDVKKAKKLLSAVPMDNNIKIITYNETRPYNPAGGEALARVISDQLSQIGLNVSIKSYTWNEYKKALNRQEGDAFLYGWTGDNGDPDNFLYPLFSSAHIDTGLNTFKFNNPELDTLLATAQKTKNNSLRRELYNRCLKIIDNEIPLVPLNHSKKIYASTPGISNFKPHFTGWNQLHSIKLH